MMHTTKPAEIVTLRRTRFARPQPQGTAFVLAVVEGPDAGLVVTLDSSSPRALLGQSPVCTIRLGDQEISRRHAAVSVIGESLQLLDLGSTNGTSVNGVLVKEATLLGGEAIRIGGTVLSVRRDNPRYVELVQSTSFGRAQGESTAMKKLYPVLAKLADSDAPVLLEGEPGTGKELVAEELHLASKRKDGAFIVLEASALPTNEIGDKLFALDGIWEQARGGVLFIDEIGNLPRDVQTRLKLSIAQDPTVRVIAATRRDLDRDVASGRFDDALFFALAPGRVELPALRERDGDVAALARHFWRDLDPNGALPEDFLPASSTTRGRATSASSAPPSSRACRKASSAARTARTTRKSTASTSSRRSSKTTFRSRPLARRS